MLPFADYLSGPVWTFVFLVAIAWSAVWKGIALWRAARNAHLVWFIVLMVVNTLGILEIVYILGFSRKKDAKPAAPQASTA